MEVPVLDLSWGWWCDLSPLSSWPGDLGWVEGVEKWAVSCLVSRVVRGAREADSVSSPPEGLGSELNS